MAMCSLNIAGRIIGENQPVFIIAEIGQNHQGDIDIAKKLIKTAKKCGADCVKFQKSCLGEKFNKLALSRPYNNINSWGKTYGDHKRYLEFNEEQYVELQAFSNEIGILFTASAMDAVSLNFLEKIKVPFIKIGSGDANNLLLIEEAAGKNIPLIISTGMQELSVVEKIYERVSKFHQKFALLHCVSAYPTPLEDINLRVLSLYKEKFPDVPIGYSGHELGTHISLAAVALGATILERHITLDKNQKGSDHKCSLEPNEFKSLIQNVRDLERALGKPEKILRESERACSEKLGKTIVARRFLKKGTTLATQDLNIKVAEPRGIDGSLIETLLGKKLARDIQEDQSMMASYLE